MFGALRRRIKSVVEAPPADPWQGSAGSYEAKALYREKLEAVATYLTSLGRTSSGHPIVRTRYNQVQSAAELFFLEGGEPIARIKIWSDSLKVLHTLIFDFSLNEPGKQMLKELFPNAVIVPRDPAAK